MIIFGGLGPNNILLNDTWVLSGADGTAAGAVFDAAADKMIIFGGANTSGFLNDIWTLSHANGLGGTSSWKQAIPVSTSPSPRVQVIMNYRASAHRLVIFAGADATRDLNETWVLMNIS